MAQVTTVKHCYILCIGSWRHFLHNQPAKEPDVPTLVVAKAVDTEESDSEVASDRDDEGDRNSDGDGEGEGVSSDDDMVSTDADSKQLSAEKF